MPASPDESGKRRREKGLARAGNARVRCGMIQVAWRFLRFQKDSFAQWFRARTAGGRGSTRTKLLIALWRLATTGEVSDGIVLTSGVVNQQTARATDNRLGAPC
jgi:transposase